MACAKEFGIKSSILTAGDSTAFDACNSEGSSGANAAENGDQPLPEMAAKKRVTAVTLPAGLDAVFFHGDINVPDLGELTDGDFLGLEEFVADDLALFADLQRSLE